MSTATKLTYEDYVLMPDDGQRHELIDGELFVVPAPGFSHQSVLARLHLLIGPYVERHGGTLLFAPFDVILSLGNVVQPDLLFVAAKHSSRIEQRGVNGAPDLVVEVLSSAGKRRDEVTKRALYERFGVPEYWLVDPDAKSFRMLSLVNGVYEPTLTSSTFPNLDLPLFA